MRAAVLPVVCRCGDRHSVATDTLPCRFCGIPTFDIHGVCAGCRGAEERAERVVRS